MKITFIHGLIGAALGLLTTEAQETLNDATSIIYPGDWIPESLRIYFGERLHYGRHLTLADVLMLCQTHAHTVILFNGDGRLFSGRKEAFPDLMKLQAHLEQAGHTVRSLPGLSSALLALHEAQWELSIDSPEASLTIAAPLADPTAGLHALEQLADTSSTLALLWWEDRSNETFDVLMHRRGPKTHACIVRNMGSPTMNVQRGTLSELREQTPLSPPAVLLVKPAARHNEG